MADLEIRLTKDELLRQMTIRDFWSEIAFQEGYEVAPGYSFDDIEVDYGRARMVAGEPSDLARALINAAAKRALAGHKR